VLDGIGVVRAWAFEQLLEVVRGALGGRPLALSLDSNYKRVPVPLLVPLFLPERSEVPSPAPSSCLALPRERSKIALTSSSPKAWLVVISRTSLAVRGPLRPSLWTRDSQVVLDRNAPMTLASVTSGSSLHCLEKH
jgi:hypothetical protein